ncbi:CBS domain-containing protein [Nakamurella silvestris]|nr:CBS domain-containing protein [Nakamurella silvestris]
MHIRDAMVHPVVTVRADAPVGEAAQSLVRNGFTALPVTDDDGSLIGIVTEADLLTDTLAGPRAGSEHRHRAGPAKTVGQVMTTPVESLTPGAAAVDAARMMLDERIRCLPVVDGRSIVGIVTRRDLLRVGLTRQDALLADAVQKQLAAFADSNRWTVYVRAGVVKIEDYVDNPADRVVAKRLAESVPGVAEVLVTHCTPDPF